MNCLQCGAPLEQDFGIVACTQCGAVMMIDMDGKAQLAESATGESVGVAASATDSVQLPEAEPIGEVTPAENPISDFVDPVVIDEPTSIDLAVVQTENRTETVAAADTAAEPEIGEPASDASWFDQGIDQNLSGEQAVDAALAAAQVDARLASADFSDVAEFGNQEGDTGALRFELILSGLDHADLQHEVAGILSDPRLFLNIKDLSEQMSQGILVIPGLSAARTSLLVSRLRHLKLGIQWRQTVYEV